MLIRRFKDYLRNKTWVFLKAKWKLRSGIQVEVENDSDWFVYNEIFANKEYDKAFEEFIPTASATPLILDLGANVGYFSIRVADELEEAGLKNYRILSLEAHPTNFNVLSRRVSQQSLAGKIHPYLGLAGHRTGNHELANSGQHYGHSAAGAESGKKKLLGDYIDIEKLIGDVNKNIDLLKCDIEGSEEIFIKNYPALLSRCAFAVFEFHAGECDVDNCRILLSEAGLVSIGIVKKDPAFGTSVELFRQRK